MDAIPAEEVLPLCLTFYFYWVNFGALSRGTAACGLMVLHGLLLGCGFRAENSIPQGVQLDWEAITTPSPIDFVRIATPYFKVPQFLFLPAVLCVNL